MFLFLTVLYTNKHAILNFKERARTLELGTNKLVALLLKLQNHSNYLVKILRQQFCTNKL